MRRREPCSGTTGWMPGRGRRGAGRRAAGGSRCAPARGCSPGAGASPGRPRAASGAPDPGGVAHQEVLLEPRGVGSGRIETRRQVAEPGRHAVDDLARGDEPLDRRREPPASGRGPPSSSVAPAPRRATASTSAIVRSAPVRTIGSVRGADRVGHDARIVGYPRRLVPRSAPEAVRARVHRPDRHPVPRTRSTARVGYLGVMVAMAIESAMIPLPSELILPYAGLPRLGRDASSSR